MTGRFGRPSLYAAAAAGLLGFTTTAAAALAALLGLAAPLRLPAGPHRAQAGQVPFATPDNPISARDRGERQVRGRIGRSASKFVASIGRTAS